MKLNFLQIAMSEQLMIISVLSFLFHRFYIWGKSNGFRDGMECANKYRNYSDRTAE